MWIVVSLSLPFLRICIITVFKLFRCFWSRLTTSYLMMLGLRKNLWTLEICRLHFDQTDWKSSFGEWILFLKDLTCWFSFRRKKIAGKIIFLVFNLIKTIGTTLSHDSWGDDWLIWCINTKRWGWFGRLVFGRVVNTSKCWKWISLNLICWNFKRWRRRSSRYK